MIPEGIKEEILNKGVHAFSEVFWDYLSEKARNENLSRNEIFEEIEEEMKFMSNYSDLSYEEKVKRVDEHLKEFLRTSPISPIRNEWPNCFKDEIKQEDVLQGKQELDDAKWEEVCKILGDSEISQEEKDEVFKKIFG